MLFFTPKILLLLKRRSLEIYDKGSGALLAIDFPPSAVSHLEVINKDDLVKQLVEGFKQAEVEGKSAVLALSEHVIFEKEIAAREAQLNEELNKFYHNVPLEEANIAKKVVPLHVTTLAMATNRVLLDTVLEVCGEFNMKIKAAVPTSMYFKHDEQTPLNQEQVKKILSSDDVFKIADFMQEDTIQSELKPTSSTDSKKPAEDNSFNDDDEDKPAKTSAAMTIIALLICAGAIIASFIYFKIIPNPLDFLNSKINPQPTPLASLVPETTQASPSAQVAATESSLSAQPASTTSSQLQRSQVKLHVLNGSGTAGQAAKLKQILVDQGFTQVVTGNIEGDEASESAITYSQKVDKVVKQDVAKLIIDNIGQVEESTDNLTEFDIVVTIGKAAKILE